MVVSSPGGLNCNLNNRCQHVGCFACSKSDAISRININPDLARALNLRIRHVVGNVCISSCSYCFDAATELWCKVLVHLGSTADLIFQITFSSNLRGAAKY